MPRKKAPKTTTATHDNARTSRNHDVSNTVNSTNSHAKSSSLDATLHSISSVSSGKEPVWGGPEKDGITFSLLSRWLSCRERFRLLTVKGVQAITGWNHRIEFGNMWHLCEEVYANQLSGVSERPWEDELKTYCQSQCKEYVHDQQHIEKWYQIVRRQFPLYLDYWRENDDVRSRVNILSEHCFAIPYTLPSGRVVILRGKLDSLDLIGRRQERLYLQENKTKGEVNHEAIERQLTFDLQTMLYLTALQCHIPELVRQDKLPEQYLFRDPAGVRYNVVLRPLSGGKGTIIQKKPTKTNPHGETTEQYYQRLMDYIRAEPVRFFARWKVEVSTSELRHFRSLCLDPILETLCRWWDFVTGKDPSQWWTHWQHPYGVYNTLDEGGTTEFDHYLKTGDMTGLQRVKTLYPELTTKEDIKCSS